MKAAVLHAFDEKLTAKEFVKYEDVTDPKISRPMDVIVRIGGAGVCRTDLHIVEGIWRSKVDVKLPYIMGHENAGWVEAIGPGVEGVKVGDSVICHPLVTSGHCLACRRGEICTHWIVRFLASTPTAVTRNTCSRASVPLSNYRRRWRRKMSLHTPTPG
jgi:D-arabinose 1-dehydrogenase-like Zn-dependent alcohol dehydrogenase